MTLFIIFVLSIAIVIKIWATIHAILWLRRQGSNFNESINIMESREKHQLSQNDFYILLEKHHGYFFPYGVKEYRLEKYIDKLKLNIISNKILSCLKITYIYIIKGLQLFFFKPHGLLFTIFVIVIFATFLLEKQIKIPQFFFNYLFNITLTIFILNFLVIYESILRYSILKKYAVKFHTMFKPKNDILAEITVLLGLSSIAIGTGVVSGYLSTLSKFTSFQGYSNSWYSKLWDFTNFSVSMFVSGGNGNLEINYFFGEIVAVILQIQGFMLLIVFLFAVSRSDQNPTFISNGNQ